MLKAQVKAIEYYLPNKVLSNEDLTTVFPDLSAAKIESMTGVREKTHLCQERMCI